MKISKEYLNQIPDNRCFFYSNKLALANLIEFICLSLSNFSEKKKVEFFIKMKNDYKYKFIECDIENYTIIEISQNILNGITEAKSSEEFEIVSKISVQERIPVFEIVDDIYSSTSVLPFTVFISDNISQIKFSGDIGNSTEKIFKLCFENAIEYAKEYDKIFNLKVSELNIMSDYEKNLINSFNNINNNEVKHILYLLQERCIVSANEIAMECTDKSVTYGEFFSKALKYANKFTQRGLKNGDIAAIYVDYSIEMVCIMVAVWMCGAAYIPIAKEFPDERLKYMLSDSNTKYIITDYDDDKFSEYILISVDECENSDIELENMDLSLDNDAYIIYTSGSTGKPKGTLIGHRSLAHMMQSSRLAFPVDEDDSVISVTTCSFDIFLSEIMWPLLSGARLVIASAEERANPQRINEKIKYSACNVFQTTPSRIKWMQMCGASDCLMQIDKLLCAGEVFPNELLKKLQKIPGIRIFNGYGPTETTIYASISELTDRNDVVIGKSLENYGFLILNDEFEPVNIGKLGQLCIYGKGLAKCYINKPELTSEKFIDYPSISEKIYLTGDLARWNINGEAEVVGRNDFQVKINGYRVELGDIECVTDYHPLVKNSAAVAFEENGVKKIAVIYTGESEISKQEFVEHYSSHLPSYMIPSICVYAEYIPLNFNGKVDNKKVIEYIKSAIKE